MSEFLYSDDNKRYHTVNYFLKKRFGQKVFKVPLNVDLGCPNRDGTKGVGGCAFCSAKKSGDFGGDPTEDIRSQYEAVRTVMDKKWSGGLCIPYFQAGSNTYCSVDMLRKMCSSALALEGAVGLSIATRADCLDKEKCALLGEYAKNTFLTVELGLQTVFDETALAMNRCHTYGEFLRGVDMLRAEGINVCVHLINGLPGENREMMLTSAETVSRLDIQAVKIHLLHVLRGTQLEKLYNAGGFKTLEREEYVGIVCDQLERLRPEIVIQRLTGDGDRSQLISPLWSTDKRMVLNMIDMEMKRRNTVQGRLSGDILEE
ncbi:MAG: TIGR01212 family radical SAM protein [Ruminococcus sp.]|nr:TIGR01212 family radical SAM protein [Ruminococcus sp.]